MYRDLEGVILQDSHRRIIHTENEVFTTKKLTKIEITNDYMCCKYCTEYF